MSYEMETSAQAGLDTQVRTYTGDSSQELVHRTRTA